MNRTPSHPSAAQRRVQQMISMAPKQFEELTVCHLSRRLELNDNKLDELINGKAKSSGRKNSLMRIASPFHVKRAKCESEKDGGRMDVEVCSETVNAVCKLILSLNNTSDLQEEGLFRKSGSIARLRELKEKILKDCSLDLSPYTPHDRANVIKQLLMDIPEPLLLERHFEAFEQATGLCYNPVLCADALQLSLPSLSHFLSPPPSPLLKFKKIRCFVVLLTSRCVQVTILTSHGKAYFRWSFFKNKSKQKKKQDPTKPNQNKRKQKINHWFYIFAHCVQRAWFYIFAHCVQWAWYLAS